MSLQLSLGLSLKSSPIVYPVKIAKINIEYLFKKIMNFRKRETNNYVQNLDDGNNGEVNSNLQYTIL